ncbi:glycosyltransferase [Microseira sp. BLCC-F43]|jgi:dolichol-phosphate mannosyltransferase|uniref:glycosyltransferase n=1 Tax=Microseira sp. BLCC-F43 TaxID=3153602 RepID=UPI0035B97B14
MTNADYSVVIPIYNEAETMGELWKRLSKVFKQLDGDTKVIFINDGSYISGLRSYAGFKQTGIVVERGPRYKGEPRVTVLKLFKLAFDGIFSCDTIPWKISTFLGFVLAIASFIIGLIGLDYKLILGQEFLEWNQGLTTALFLGGIQLISLGIIGEYIGRIYERVKQRPYYIIREQIGFEE